MLTLDRGNIAFAATQMNKDLNLDAASYGLAAGLYFVTYGALQVPSAAIGARVGMRWWLGAITIAWGLTAMSMAFVQTPGQLYACRLLLGAFEAGATPCCYQIMSSYYPYSRLSKPYSSLFLGGQLSSIISAPLAAALLSLGGAHGLAGWRWLLLIEGIPTVILGFVLLILLPADPLTCWWLPPDHREALHLAVHGPARAEEARRRPSMRRMWATMLETLRQPLVWAIMAAAFLWVLCAFSLYAWVPLIVSNLMNGTAVAASTAMGPSKANSVKATLLSTVPYAVAALAVVGNAWHSDRTGERTIHVAVPWLTGGVVLACFGAVARRSIVGGFVMLTAAMGLAFSGQSVLVTRAAGIMPPSQAAISMSFMNAVCAGAGGFAGPFAVGAMVGSLKSFEYATLAMSAFLLASGLIVVGMAVWERRTGAAGGGGAGGKGAGGAAPPLPARGATMSMAAAAADGAAARPPARGAAAAAAV
ncbi:MFS transporter [Raphidocelis subcapitata]|uniref:MFS transporter n=1 Tax=Raphidocelis subcapitata TaxID=307507 RepID=A0A2V0NZG4_9CHLO|nr:MFS transporter [Raphidocelis subcapitata]|eukprot:GBF93031.1 MFS transporter [Raphidocelis subcapitata]